MNFLLNLLSALFTVYFLNIPFGYWRAGSKKLSLSWILAIHTPVPAVFIIRFIAGSDLIHLPIFIMFFFLGQLTGGGVRVWMGGRAKSLCLIMDLVKSAM
ncbi:MAG: hypothetical protein QXU28_04100 [Nitrososphaerota archaeon]